MEVKERKHARPHESKILFLLLNIIIKRLVTLGYQIWANFCLGITESCLGITNTLLDI